MNIAQYTKTTVPTTAAENESQLTTASVGTVNEQGQEQPLNENYQQQTEVAQNTPPPAPAPAPQALPKTASPLPLIGLLGLISLAGFFSLRLIRES